MSFVRSYLGLQVILLIQQYIVTFRHATSVSVASGRYTKFGEYPNCSLIQTDFLVFFNSFFELCLNSAELRLDRIWLI